MEIGKLAMTTPNRSPGGQTKLTQVYRVAKHAPDVEKTKGDGLCRLLNFGFAKQEPVDEAKNVVEPSVVIETPEAAPSWCRVSSTMTLFSPRGVQSRYNAFPETEPVTKTLEIHNPTVGSLKVELPSPGSCVTNDSVFHDVSPTVDAEMNCAAHVNASEAKCVHAKSVIVFPCGKESVPETQATCVIGIDPLQYAPPVKSLMTASVMLPGDSISERNKKPLTPASSDSSTSDVATAVMVTTGSLPSVQKVKVETVEAKEKLITALDMFGGGGGGEEGPLSGGEAHLQSKKVEAPPPDAVPQKLMTAVDMFPSEVHKCEAMEHSQVDVGCEGMYLAPGRNVLNASAPLKPVLLHVKSEPVDNFGARELGKLALQNELARYLRNAVKQEFLNSTPEDRGGFITELRTPQKPSENEHSSSGCEDTDDTEGEYLPTQVHNGAEDDIRMRGRIRQKRDNAQESQKIAEIKNRNSNPGMRIQGGRIYDSFLGKTCHWCRQKTVEHHVKCRQCTIYYCGACLMNRNGENIREELAEGARWLCPKCRNGCGPGCDNCCNCGPCRKADGKAPTGQLVWVARNVGFLNAHDYLVHLETGETPEEIAKRKVGRDWTNCGRFEWKESSENAESSDEPSSSEGTDSFTLDEETSTQLHEGKIGMKVVKKFVESQKRKRGSVRGALSANESQVEVTPSHIDDYLSKWKEGKERNRLIARSFEKASKGKENEAKAESRRGEQTLTEDSALRFIQEDLALRENNSGMKTCKREYVEANAGNGVLGSDVDGAAVAKRRKREGYDWEERHSLVSSRSSSLGSLSRAVKCKVEPTILTEYNPGIVGIDNSNEAGPKGKFISDADTSDCQSRPSNESASENELNLKMRGASQLMSDQRGLECPSDPQGTVYRTKLKAVLAQPFDVKELEMLEESAKTRKPVQRLRQMRGRIVDVVTEDEGLSYLDHHPDLALKLEETQSPPLKLALLRGFFFWLQHSCMEGAFKPWPGALTESRPQSGDCIETEGPDCLVTAVVLPLEEEKDALHPDDIDEAHRRLKRKFMKSMPRPLAIKDGVREPHTTSNPLGSSTSRQTLIPFQARKNSVQQHVKLPKMKGKVPPQPGMNYRVVLCLPAPALFKK